MPPRPSVRSVCWAAVTSLCVSALTGAAASAQVIERHLPPTPQPTAPVIVAPNAIPAEQDATPIGPPLRAILLLGPTEPARPSVPNGITGEAAAARLNPRRVDAALRPFLGRPISRKLIAEIEAMIAKLYRGAGYPFVSVSTPEQEITTGALQVRIVEFKAGKISAQGETRTPSAYITSHVRLRPDQPISSTALSEDLDWLNRYPFRRVEAVFTPGAGLGETELVLHASESKPWLVYGGYSNSGSASAGWDRYFVGAEAGGIIVPDGFVSLQATASADALFDKQRLFNEAPDPKYVSYAGRLVLPTNPRGEIEATVDWVQTNQVSAPFLVRQTTYEGALGYRFALSNLSPWLLGVGDGRFGVEAKRQDSRTFFGGTDVFDAAMEVYQVYLGYEKTEDDPFGRSDLDILAHLSPGGLTPANDKARAILYSHGRVGDARYAYVDVTFNRTTRLIGNWSWLAEVIGQYSARPLPRTEEVAIGSQPLVRGYSLDDGAFDQAILIRNELRPPAFSLLKGPYADQLSPYAFLDAGLGKDEFTKRSVTASSVGLGADYQIASHIALNLDGAYALTKAVYTRAGDARLETRLTVSF